MLKITWFVFERKRKPADVIERRISLLRETFVARAHQCDEITCVECASLKGRLAELAELNRSLGRREFGARR